MPLPDRYLLKINAAWAHGDADKAARLRDQLSAEGIECSLWAAASSDEEREAIAAMRCCTSVKQEKIKYVVVTLADVQSFHGTLKQDDGDGGPEHVRKRHYNLSMSPTVADALVRALDIRRAEQCQVKHKDIAPILKTWLETGSLANIDGQEDRVRRQLGL